MCLATCFRVRLVRCRLADQMLELQQQLCDAEAAAGSLRDANSELTSKVEVLEAHAVNAGMWQQSQVR